MRVPPIFDDFEHGLLSDDPLRQLMDQYFDIGALRKGLPLYVSVFRSQGALRDILSTLAAELGVVDTPESEFLHIQSLPDAEQKEALLASAAIPLLFAPKRVHDSPYSDGGMGGLAKTPGEYADHSAVAGRVQDGNCDASFGWFVVEQTGFSGCNGDRNSPAIVNRTQWRGAGFARLRCR